MSKKKKIIVAVFVALAVAGVVAWLLVNKQDKPETAAEPTDESGLNGKIIIPAQLTPMTNDEGGESGIVTQPSAGKGNKI